MQPEPVEHRPQQRQRVAAQAQPRCNVVRHHLLPLPLRGEVGGGFRDLRPLAGGKERQVMLGRDIHGQRCPLRRPPLGQPCEAVRLHQGTEGAAGEPGPLGGLLHQDEGSPVAVVPDLDEAPPLRLGYQRNSRVHRA